MALSTALNVRLTRHVVAAGYVAHDFVREIRASAHSPGAGARRVPSPARAWQLYFTNAGLRSQSSNRILPRRASPAGINEQLAEFGSEVLRVRIDDNRARVVARGEVLTNQHRAGCPPLAARRNAAHRLQPSLRRLRVCASHEITWHETGGRRAIAVNHVSSAFIRGGEVVAPDAASKAARRGSSASHPRQRETHT